MYGDIDQDLYMEQSRDSTKTLEFPGRIFKFENPCIDYVKWVKCIKRLFLVASSNGSLSNQLKRKEYICTNKT